jgi:hypothetical protein
MFPIENGLKRGDILLSFLFNFALECAIRRVKVNKDSLKLNGKYKILFQVDDINTWGEAFILKRKTDTL